MNRLAPPLLAALVLALAPPMVRAHCDTLEGPVVTAARAALAAGQVTPVLMWVRPAGEPAVKAAFDQTLIVRQQSPQAAELADRWFFETLVRVHRAGEGAPYTGLKSGAVEEPGIATADRALASGRPDELLKLTTVRLQSALTAKLERVRALQAHAAHSVEAGREYVAAYVDYLHFAERLAQFADATPTHGPTNHAH